MAKTTRLIVLLEPSLAAGLKDLAKKKAQKVSEVVRTSIQSYLEAQKAARRMRQIGKLGRFRIPLEGLEDPERLETALLEGYRP